MSEKIELERTPEQQAAKQRFDAEVIAARKAGEPTPRTDAWEFDAILGTGRQPLKVVLSKDARQLERELSQLKEIAADRLVRLFAAETAGEALAVALQLFMGRSEINWQDAVKLGESALAQWEALKK